MSFNLREGCDTLRLKSNRNPWRQARKTVKHQKKMQAVSATSDDYVHQS
jgi:hypothetical protein